MSDTTNPSATDAFEDAEMARKEHFALSDLLWANVDNAGIHGRLYWEDCIFLAKLAIAHGYSRQSPASTTAADAWAEGARWAAVECGVSREDAPFWLAPGDNPYRVAAPEGDGGNE